MLYRFIDKKDLNSYELENKRLSYKNLFYNDDSLILCNNIAKDYLELQSGFNDDDDEYLEVYQYYIITDNLAKRLIEINEIVYYHEKLDIYVLGVTHFGTSWDYVLTNLKLLELDDTYYKVIYDDDDDDDNE